MSTLTMLVMWVVLVWMVLAVVVMLMGMMVWMMLPLRLVDALSAGDGGSVAVADALSMTRVVRESSRRRRCRRRGDRGHGTPAETLGAR